MKQDDFDFDLNSPLSILLDDTDELDLLNEMMIQPSSTHFQHPRQPNQNYAHCVNSYRQNGYQVRVVKGLADPFFQPVNDDKATYSECNPSW